MNRELTRRRALKLGTAGAATAAVSSDQLPSELTMVDDAEAIPCGGLCVGGLIVAGAAGAGASAALYEFDILGEDPPPDGLSASALQNEAKNKARARKSTNQSAIVDNENILEFGFRDTLYSKAKIEAFERINNGETESSVLSGAKEVANKHAATIEKNLLKTWNESVNELTSIQDSFQEHGSTSISDISYSGTVYNGSTESYNFSHFNDGNGTQTLADGTDFTVKKAVIESTGDNWYDVKWDPIDTDYWGPNGGDESSWNVSQEIQLGSVTYLKASSWRTVWDNIQSEISTALNEIDAWVSNTYGSVQSGELDSDDLLNPSDRAKLLSEQEDVPQALADLRALNVPYDPERTATVEIQFANGTTTMVGTLASTAADLTLEAGKTYDPANLSGGLLMSTDVSTVSGQWTAYKDGVDGGVVTLTAEPLLSTIYLVSTTDGEVAELPASGFSKNNNDNWEQDASDELENEITSVDSIEMAPAQDETQYENMRIENSFTVKKFVNSEGETVSKADFEQSEPHDDTNYISQEEWEKREERYQDLIDQYEDSQSGGGGGFLDGGGGLLGFGTVPDVAIIGGAGYLAYDTFIND